MTDGASIESDADKAAERRRAARREAIAKLSPEERAKWRESRGRRREARTARRAERQAAAALEKAARKAARAAMSPEERKTARGDNPPIPFQQSLLKRKSRDATKA